MSHTCETCFYHAAMPVVMDAGIGSCSATVTFSASLAFDADAERWAFKPEHSDTTAYVLAPGGGVPRLLVRPHHTCAMWRGHRRNKR
jgi:hypothetical protein